MNARLLIPRTLVILGLVLFIDTFATADIVVDDYTIGSTIAQFGAGTSNQTTNSVSILGGARDSSLTVRSLGGNEFFGIQGFNGNVSIAQGSQDRIFGSMVYDNFTSIDLTQAGLNDKFFLNVVGNDSLATLNDVFSITVVSGASFSTVNFGLPGSPDLPTDISVGFDEFSGIDFTSVDSIELAFDFVSSPGIDVAISGFTVSVPEPSSVLMFASTVGGAFFYRRRRSNS